MEEELKLNSENNVTEPFTELDIDTFRKYINNTEHLYQTAQHSLCFAIISRIYRRVLNNYYFGPIKIDGDMIVDGNHRFIAYDLAKIKFEIIKATRSHCDNVKKFNEIHLEIQQDWDANNPKTEHYCNDDFLANGKYLRNSN